MRTSSDKASFQDLVHAARKAEADKGSAHQLKHAPQEVKQPAGKHLKKKQ